MKNDCERFSDSELRRYWVARMQMDDSADLDGSLAAIHDHVERCAECSLKVDQIDLEMASREQAGAERNLGVRMPVDSIDREALPREDKEVFPGYELLKEIGRGGFGVVYQAIQLRLYPRKVALKVMNIEGDSTRDRARFKEEIKALVRLNHPGIVQIYDAGDSVIKGLDGDADGHRFFAMELVEGENLASYLRTKKWPEEWPKAREAAEWIYQLTRAVDHAHRKGVVHRDLKPSNVLIQKAKEGRAILKITDFGIAKIVDEFDESSLRRYIAGTFAYMAPEQFRRQSDPHQLALVDIYSLGVILYELLTGRRPFNGTTEADLRRQVLKSKPVPPVEINPEVDKDLNAICLRCLEKNPKKRFQKGENSEKSAKKLQADLGRYLRGKPPITKTEIYNRPRHCLDRSTSPENAPAPIEVMKPFLGTGLAELPETPTSHLSVERKLSLRERMVEAFEIARQDLLGLLGGVLGGVGGVVLARALDKGYHGISGEISDLWGSLSFGNVLDAFTRQTPGLVIGAMIGGLGGSAVPSGQRTYQWSQPRDRRVILWNAFWSFLGAVLGGLVSLLFFSEFFPNTGSDAAPYVVVIGTWAGALTSRKFNVERGAVLVGGPIFTLALFLVIALFGGLTSLVLPLSWKYPLFDDISIIIYMICMLIASCVSMAEDTAGFEDYHYFDSSQVLQSIVTKVVGLGILVSLFGYWCWSVHGQLERYSVNAELTRMVLGNDRIFVGTRDIPGRIIYWDEHRPGAFQIASEERTENRTGTGSGMPINSAVLSVAQSPGRLLLAAGDGTPNEDDAPNSGVRLLTVDRDSSTLRWAKPTGYSVLCVAFSPDGRQVISCSQDGLIFWDSGSGDKLGTLELVDTVPEGLLKELAKVIAERLKAEKLVVPQTLILDAPVFRLQATGYLAGQPWARNLYTPRAAAFSLDGISVAWGDGHGDVVMWDTSSRRQRFRKEGAHGKSMVVDVEFSPDGDVLATAAWSGTIRLWNARTGDLRWGNTSHPDDRVAAVAFSPDGRWLVSGGREGKSGVVRLLDVSSGREIVRYKVRTDFGWVSDVVFSPRGDRLFSASRDGRVRVWAVPPSPN